MTYTKGPWVRHQGEHGESIFGEISTPSYCGPLNICDIPYKVGSKGMAKANAALIISAQDLLVALEGLVADWERVHGPMPHDHEARVAIAKAKGRKRLT